MIVSDQHKLIFVDIAKCGGTTIRTVLRSIDERQAQFQDWNIADHPVLGRIDYGHLPMAIIKDHFPDEFVLFSSYRSFDMERDPALRFCSAVNPRHKGVKGSPLTSLDQATFQSEADEAIALLDRHSGDVMLPTSLIHFTRQWDYVALEGEVIVSDIFHLDHLEAMLQTISQHSGRNLSQPPRTEAVAYGNAPLAKLDAVIQPFLKRTLPRSAWKPLFVSAKRGLMAAGLLAPEKADRLDQFLSPNQRQFIEDYYKRDYSLLDEVT